MPTGCSLDKNLRILVLFDGTLNAHNFGHNGPSCNFLGPSSSQRSHGSGGKKIWDFDLFCLRSGPKREPNLKSALKCADFSSFFDTLNFESPLLWLEWTKCRFFFAHHQATEVTDLGGKKFLPF